MVAKLNKTERAELTAIIIAYEDARSILSDFLRDMAMEWREEIEEKSERWQEGEAGTEALARVDTMQGWSDNFDDPCEIDPDEVS